MANQYKEYSLRRLRLWLRKTISIKNAVLRFEHNEKYYRYSILLIASVLLTFASLLSTFYGLKTIIGGNIVPTIIASSIQLILFFSTRTVASGGILKNKINTLIFLITLALSVIFSYQFLFEQFYYSQDKAKDMISEFIEDTKKFSLTCESHLKNLKNTFVREKGVVDAALEFERKGGIKGRSNSGKGPRYNAIESVKRNLEERINALNGIDSSFNQKRDSLDKELEEVRAYIKDNSVDNYIAKFQEYGGKIRLTINEIERLVLSTKTISQDLSGLFTFSISDTTHQIVEKYTGDKIKSLEEEIRFSIDKPSKEEYIDINTLNSFDRLFGNLDGLLTINYSEIPDLIRKKESEDTNRKRQLAYFLAFLAAFILDIIVLLASLAGSIKESFNQKTDYEEITKLLIETAAESRDSKLSKVLGLAQDHQVPWYYGIPNFFSKRTKISFNASKMTALELSIIESLRERGLVKLYKKGETKRLKLKPELLNYLLMHCVEDLKLKKDNDLLSNVKDVGKLVEKHDFYSFIKDNLKLDTLTHRPYIEKEKLEKEPVSTNNFTALYILFPILSKYQLIESQGNRYYFNPLFTQLFLQKQEEKSSED